MAEPDTGAPAEVPFGIPDAGLAIEGILDRLDAENEDPEAPPVKTESKPETPPEEEETPTEGEGEEEAPTEDEEKPEETPAPLYTVKIDGKEKQVSLEELQRGYSGQQWITQRSQAIAEERKSFDAERKAVSEERALYAQYLGQLRDQLDKGDPEPDWEKLRAEDEFKFVVERQAWMLKQERKAAAQAEIQRVQSLQAMETEAQIRQKLIEGRHALQKAIPAWKDMEKFEAGKAEIREYAKSIGFTEEEIAQTYDPRAVLALHKAAQFDKLAKAKIPAVQQRVPRTAQPGSVDANPGRPAELTRMKQRLAKTGSVDDAAAIFEQSGAAG